MILLRDASRLALTKLRIRIPRLVVTVVIASLLFALVVFMVSVVQGMLGSVTAFNSEGLSKRYLVVGYSANGVPYDSPTVIAQLEKTQADIIARKKAEAKRLGLEYDPKSEHMWVDNVEGPGGVKQKTFIGYDNPQALKILEDWQRSQPQANYADFQAMAKKGGAIATYRMPQDGSFSTASTAYLRVVTNGKESFTKSQNQDPFSRKGFATLENGTIRSAPESLIGAFLLQGQHLKVGSEGSIPVYVPFSVAEESMGLKPLAAGAKSAEKLARIKQVRQNIAGKTIQVCYRNSTSAEKVQSASTQKQQDEENKNNKDYQRPALVYGLPTTACTEAPVIRDVRDAEQKKLDAKQLQFDQLFGKEQAVSRIETFRVVGVLPDMADVYSNSVAGILSMVLSSSVGGGWVVPESVTTDPKLQGIVTPIDQVSPQTVQFIAELPSAEAQKTFIREQSCDMGKDVSAVSTPTGVVLSSTGGPISTENTCVKQGKYFVFASFGNNAAAIEEFQNGFSKVFTVALIVLAVLSSLVMMGIIGRIIADSRRETAVFRAIGATRLDMSLVYIVYTFVLATFVCIASLGMGWAAAQIFSQHFGPIVTPSALLIFGGTDFEKQFVFVGFDSSRLMIIAAVVYVAALVGSLPPLLVNLRRSPLRDMRDEN